MLWSLHFGQRPISTSPQFGHLKNVMPSFFPSLTPHELQTFSFCILNTDLSHDSFLLIYKDVPLYAKKSGNSWFSHQTPVGCWPFVIGSKFGHEDLFIDLVRPSFLDGSEVRV